ncbi:hemagglutinin repeat-containing protein [Labrys neptuniae]
MTATRSKALRVLKGMVASTAIFAHLSQVAFAQMVPDTAVPANQPGMGTSSGGRPVINIVTPQSGVSLNKFKTFSIGADGVIVNNSRADVTAKKGGVVKANPNLQTSGPANVIVHQVGPSGAASALKGDLELIGTSADIIIANPNGITCDGCSFTGARKTTLTTGGVVVNNGKVGISVFDGVTQVGRGGLTSDGDVTLSGRNVMVDGAVTANGDLLVSGGTHAIDPDTGLPIAQPITTSRKLPYAVDATAYGAMTAGTIRIVGNENGMGVRTLGTMTTTKGDLVLQADGDLFYKDAKSAGNFTAKGTGAVNQYGTVAARGKASVSGKKVFLPGGRALTGDGGAVINSVETATIGGEVFGSTLEVNAGTDATNTGHLVGGNTVTINVTGNLTNSRDKFSTYQGTAWADAWLKSYQDLFAQWTQSTNPNEVYWGNEYFSWTQTKIVDEYLLNGGSILGGDIAITAGGSIANNGGQIAAARKVSIQAGLDFLNSTRSTINTVTLADGCTQQGIDCGTRTRLHPGEVLAGTDLAIMAGRDLINSGSTLAAYGNVDLRAKGAIRNLAVSSQYVAKEFYANLSTITGNSADAAITLTADTQKVDYAFGTVRALTGQAQLVADGDIVVSGSKVSAAKDAVLQAGGSVRLTTQVAVTTRSGTKKSTAPLGTLYNAPPGATNIYSDSQSAIAPGEVIADNITVAAGQDLIATGTRLFAQTDLKLLAKGQLIFDSGLDYAGRDNGELKANLRSTAGLADRVKDPANAGEGQAFKAYLDADPLTSGLSALHGAKDGYQLVDAARHVGTDIDFEQVTTTKKVPIGCPGGGFCNFRGYQDVTTTTTTVKPNNVGQWDNLSQALVALSGNGSLPGNEVIAAAAYDYTVRTADRDLAQTSRGLIQAGRDAGVQSETGDVIFAGGSIVNAGRSVFAKANKDLLLISLRGLGLSDGSSALARRDDFRAGLIWNDYATPVRRDNSYSFQDYTGVQLQPTLPEGSALIRDIAPTAILSGGDMTLAAGRDLQNYAGSAAAKGSLLLSAGRDVQNEAVRQYYVLTAADGCQNAACGLYGHRYVGGEFLSGSGLVVSAGQDISNVGSSIAGAGSVLLTAGRDIHNDAISSQFLINYYHKEKGWLSGGGSKTVINNLGVIQEGNVVSEFGSVTAKAGHDLTTVGSVWSAGGDVSLSAVNDILLDAKTEEMNDVYKKTGFHGIGYASNKQYWNGFVNSYADLQGANVTVDAGHNLTAIGAKFVSGTDTQLSAGNDITFDAQQNDYYSIAKGWSVGFSSPTFTLMSEALKGDGRQALRDYISQNPLAAAVHQLAVGQDNSLSNALTIVTAGARLLSAANIQARQGDSTGLVGSLVAQFDPLKGNGLDPYALLTGTGPNLSQAASNCVSNPAQCSFLVGVSLRFTSWKSEREWTESTVSRLLVGRDMTIAADRDVALMGGTYASVARNAYIEAGRNLGLASAADTSRSKSSSWGLTLGFQPNGVSIGADISRSSASATVYSNAQLLAGGNVDLVAGSDISLIGANVAGKTIGIDAGQDLLVISQQNLSKSSATSFNVSVTVGSNGPTGGSIGGSFAEGNRNYTDTPTTVIAEEGLYAYAGRTTVLAGSGIWSKTGKLKLDTGDLVFDNYKDRDTYVAASGGISVDTTSNHPWDGNLSVEYRNKTGLTFATLGAGDLNIRDRPKLDISGLNRDPANMQRVTKDTSWSFSIPALNIAKLADDITNAQRYISTLTKEVPEGIKAQGNQAIGQYQALLLSGATEPEARQLMATPKFQAMLRERRSLDALLQGATSLDDYYRSLRVISAGEEVYRDPATGELMMRANCNQMGPCDRRIREIEGASSKDLRDWIDAKLAVAKNDNENPFSRQYALAAALECAVAAAMAKDGDTSYFNNFAAFGGSVAETASKLAQAVTSIRADSELQKGYQLLVNKNKNHAVLAVAAMAGIYGTPEQNATVLAQTAFWGEFADYSKLSYADRQLKARQLIDDALRLYPGSAVEIESWIMGIRGADRNDQGFVERDTILRQINPSIDRSDFLLSQNFNNVLLLGLAGVQMGGAIGQPKLAGCSFDGSTLVETNHGFMAIRDVRPGIDEVWSRDEDGSAGFKVIQGLLQDWHPDRLYLTVRSLTNGSTQTITTTTNHPFFAVPEEGMAVAVSLKSGTHLYRGPIQNGAWVHAEDLKPGYRLLESRNGWADVISIRVTQEPISAYNLTIKDFHTYYVKEASNDNAKPVWVHNTDCVTIRRSDLEFERTAGGNINIFANVNGKRINIAYVEQDINGPELMIFTNTQGLKLRLDGGGLTRTILESTISDYKLRNSGQMPPNLPGSLAEDNLTNFQKEFARAKVANPTLTDQQLGDIAIRRVSFGTARIALGYGDLSVKLIEFETKTVDGILMNIPKKISVNAKPTP